MNNLKSRRDEAVRQAKITFKAGYTCPDVSLTEVVETIVKQTFDAAISELRPEIEKLVWQLERTHSALGIIGGMTHDDAVTKFINRDDGPADQITQALTKFKEFMGDSND